VSKAEISRVYCDNCTLLLSTVDVPRNWHHREVQGRVVGPRPVLERPTACQSEGVRRDPRAGTSRFACGDLQSAVSASSTESWLVHLCT
jgi:hypothetical protein